MGVHCALTLVWLCVTAYMLLDNTSYTTCHMLYWYMLNSMLLGCCGVLPFYEFL